ncbi:hypothetical protein MMC07_010005 [Pseudocyphellaria aurata]|nr:hypothetical protein [Pseudocyphellaria aurata]
MTTPEATESLQHPSSEISATKNPKGRSCVLCQQRKVKCDRKDPCAACSRAHVECVFRAPAPPRRRKRKPSQSDLLARLTRYEQLLPGLGAKIDSVHEKDATIEHDGRMEVVTTPERTAGVSRKELSRLGGKLKNVISPDVQNRRLIGGEGTPKYLERWLRNSGENFQFSSEEEKVAQATGTTSRTLRPDGGQLIFALGPARTQVLHPQPVQIFRLWQTFLDNVNPLVKILHTPTVQQLVLEASGNLKFVSKSMNALLFAIYLAAVSSLSNAECEIIVGQERSVLLANFYLGARESLISAGFLSSSDLVVLQAYVLFLTLSGIAIRFGQRLSLHRDGASLGLPTFETELRRRLWWQIILLDGRSAELSGSGMSLLTPDWDTKPPLNVNDSDLNPNMREMPVVHSGLTEMAFCLLRYEVGTFLRSSNSTSTFDDSFQRPSSAAVSISKKDKAIEDLEQLLEQKYLKFCDPSIPLHFLCVSFARSTMCMMRLQAHHPRYRSDGGASMPQNEKDVLFFESVKILELDNLNHSTQIARRFLWHTKSYFQWYALIYVLGELCFRIAGDEVDRAWQQIAEVYKYHPELLTHKKNALNIAVANLTIKAWGARETELERQQRRPQTRPPSFVSSLYSQRESRKTLSAPNLALSDPMIPTSDRLLARERQARDTQENEASMGDATSSNLDKNNPLDSTFEEYSPVDWAEWDSLLKDFESQPVDAADLPIFEHL